MAKENLLPILISIKSLFILDSPDQEEVAKWKFKAELLHLNFVGGSQYLGAYLGTREQLEACVQPTVEAWYHGVHILGKNIQAAPSISLFLLGDITSARVAVPAKDCQLSCHYDGSY